MINDKGKKEFIFQEDGMKRSRRNTLVGGMVALGLVLSGTAYAYWTDSLNVTTKATTGDFGVKFVDLGCMDSMEMRQTRVPDGL